MNYDDLGRLLHDRITTLATGIDGSVRRISTVYDVVGNVRSVTSWNNATVGQGTVLNQVLYEYDNHGLLAREFSNPSGAVVVATTPHIGYTYNTTQSGGFDQKSTKMDTVVCYSKSNYPTALGVLAESGGQFPTLNRKFR